MPKIIIREIDKTTAGNAEYENFSIALPGFAGHPVYLLAETPTSYPCIKEQADGSFKYYKSATDIDGVQVFDTNRVYECSSQSDFVMYVGKKKGDKQTKAAVGPTLENIGTAETPVYKTTLTLEEFTKYQDIAYTFTETTATSVGKLVFLDDDNKYKLCKKAVASEHTSSKLYVIIKFGNEGEDATEYPYNGNQIAYELLGLNYTILYKLVDSKLTSKTKTGIEAIEEDKFWEALKDKSTYDFRYICTGGYAYRDAYKCICDVANHKKSETLEDTSINGRGDCVALIDVFEKDLHQSTIVTDIKNYATNLAGSIQNLNQYAAIFCPQVIYSGSTDSIYQNLTFPASFHYLACAAYSKNELNFAEWYATAGYTRGTCAKTINSTSFKLGEIVINALQPRVAVGTFNHSINVITNIRGKYYLWGNRTAHELNETTSDTPGLVASHFLNIRQLCSTLKKDIYVACRKLTFDPNSDILWGKFCNAIKPTLEKMKADQGIQDYRIIKVKSSKKALLTAKVRIVPIEAVEDFDISVYLEDSVSGITVEAD